MVVLYYLASTQMEKGRLRKPSYRLCLPLFRFWQFRLFLWSDFPSFSYSWNLIRRLFHWGPPQFENIYFPTLISNNMADSRTATFVRIIKLCIVIDLVKTCSCCRGNVCGMQNDKMSVVQKVYFGLTAVINERLEFDVWRLVGNLMICMLKNCVWNCVSQDL